MIIKGNGSMSERFVEIQNELSPDYIIEVGAHGAEFSIELSQKLGIEATAFEAGPMVYEKYHSQVNSKLVSYLNYAISDIDGTVTFKVTKDELNGNSGILKRNDQDPTSEHEVKSYRLDTYFKDFNFKNACLWIDVEGASREVLEGAEETLKRASSIFIETEDYEYWANQWLTLDVIKFLNARGFILLESEPIYDAQQNLIFIRR